VAEKSERGSRIAGGRHRLKFVLVYVALAILLCGAFAAAVVMLNQSGRHSTGGWSEWRPTETGTAGATQIASYVAPRYKLASGKQLVGVLASPPEVQRLPLSFVVIKAPTNSAAQDQVFTAGSDAVYFLCGLGQSCAIAEGTPSVARAQLLRREALELALYTFRYDSGANDVIAFFPPKLGDQPKYVLYFHRQDFSRQLSHPLVQTLGSLTPPVLGKMPQAQGDIVDHLTDPQLYQFQLQQLQDGSAVLVLSKPTA
jgi:hypothetical protein